jgi:hypothetical protein
VPGSLLARRNSSVQARLASSPSRSSSRIARALSHPPRHPSQMVTVGWIPAVMLAVELAAASPARPRAPGRRPARFATTRLRPPGRSAQRGTLGCRSGVCTDVPKCTGTHSDGPRISNAASDRFLFGFATKQLFKGGT